MVNFSDYLAFYKAARKRARSNQDYVEFEKFQAKIVSDFLNKKRIMLKGKKALDIGCGRGGYTRMLLEAGAKVTALDITKDYFMPHKGIKFVRGDALSMPFKDNGFDFVFCSSLIEHVADPNKLVNEIKRVMKPHGICYLSFPPFWSPVGSHQFKPFHYLGEWAAVRISRVLYGTKSQKYDDEYGKLKKRTIIQVKRIIRRNGLRIRSISTRMSPVNFAKIPLLNEFLTWHAEFILEKP